MVRAFRGILALALFVALSGCFVSNTPLIEPSMAVYPIADGTVFEKSSENRERDTFGPFDNKVVIKRDGPYYVHEETGGDGTVSTSRGLMIEFAPGIYLVMSDDQEGKLYYYTLFVRQGVNYVQYRILCEDLVLRARKSGLEPAYFGAVKTPNDLCKFSSLDSLKSAMSFARGQALAKRWAVYKPKS